MRVAALWLQRRNYHRQSPSRWGLNPRGAASPAAAAAAAAAAVAVAAVGIAAA